MTLVCHSTTMAAALLSNRKFDKFIQNHIKLTRSFCNIKSVVLNKPQFSIICKQCASATYYRVGYVYKVPLFSKKLRLVFILYHLSSYQKNYFTFQYYSSSPNNAAGSDTAKNVLAAVLANKPKSGKIPVGEL